MKHKDRAKETKLEVNKSLSKLVRFAKQNALAWLWCQLVKSTNCTSTNFNGNRLLALVKIIGVKVMNYNENYNH